MQSFHCRWRRRMKGYCCSKRRQKPKRRKKTQKEAKEAQILRDHRGRKKKFGPFLDLCVSSLRRGHANLLCIVPILSDVPKDELLCFASRYKLIFTVVTQQCGMRFQYVLNWVGARLKVGMAQSPIYHILAQIHETTWVFAEFSGLQSGGLR